MFDNITNFTDLKKAYKAAARKAHPDMGGTTEEMQRVNAAYEAACKRIERTGERFADDAQESAESAARYTESAADMAKYAEILQKLFAVPGIEIELVGSWLWVSGDTFTHKDAIKAAGMRWSSKHKKWYWHAAEDTCKRARKSDTFEDIKSRHGSEVIRGRAPGKLAYT